MEKSIRPLVLLLTLLLLLTACEPGHYSIRKDEYIDQIEYIELVYYSNDNFEMVDVSQSTLRFDPKKAESVEMLNYENIEAFLEDFEQMEFFERNTSVDEPTGYCLLWHLKNGNYQVFSSTLIKGDRAYSMAAEFDSDNQFVRHVAHLSARGHFELILSKYFTNYSL